MTIFFSERDVPSAQTSSYPNSGSLTLVNLRAANTQIQGVFEPRTLDPSQRRRVRQNPTPSGRTVGACRASVYGQRRSKNQNKNKIPRKKSNPLR